MARRVGGLAVIKEPNERLDEFRRVHPTLGASPAGASWGYFEINTPHGTLRVISGGRGEPWEHVSVSLQNRTPTGSEMCRVKNLFFGPDETVVQFHPDVRHYVNHHPFCLHLWKRTGFDYELPGKELIV